MQEESRFIAQDIHLREATFLKHTLRTQANMLSM